jgi:hypothetical protein
MSSLRCAPYSATPTGDHPPPTSAHRQSRMRAGRSSAPLTGSRPAMLTPDASRHRPRTAPQRSHLTAVFDRPSTRHSGHRLPQRRHPAAAPALRPVRRGARHPPRPPPRYHRQPTGAWVAQQTRNLLVDLTTGESGRHRRWASLFTAQRGRAMTVASRGPVCPG